jgi:hypothetical protein
MPLSITFRLLIGLSVTLGLSSVGVDLFFTDIIPSDLSAAIERASALSLVESYPLISLAVLLPWLLASFAGVIGLFLFKQWGRSLSLYSTALGFFLFPFFGPVVSSGVSYALDEAAITLWGAALAVAFFSPISERFRGENR